MIPKTIHMSWKDKSILESTNPLVVEGVKKVIELNPTWQVTIYDDTEVDDYLKKQLEPQHYELIQDKHIVQKTDLWRLVKLFIEGGVYMDIDRFCNTNFDDLLEENVKWVLPICRNYDFSHDFMMTTPENPIYNYAASLYVQRLIEGHDNIYFLGPQTYMHAITRVLCGEMIDPDPEVEVFEKIKQQANASGSIKIYDEDPPYDTVIYKNGALKLDWETEKRKLYKEFGLKHWTGDW
jgi:mannosyltransferase OCH1-like enzyme